MKNLFFAVLAGLILALSVSSVFADCTASPNQVTVAHATKAKALALRDKGDLVGAAALYQQAAASMPMEIYAASYLLNAEGCLVGKWNPVKGYMYDEAKGTANKVAAQAILDQVKTLLATVKTNGCDYDSGVIDSVTSWYNNAQDALNGVFH